MDRMIFYPGEVLLSNHLLKGEKNTMIGLGFMARATLGTNVVFDGLQVSPTSPASLTINIGPGTIYQLLDVDDNAYGGLGTDNNNLVKQGIQHNNTQATLSPPGNAGKSIAYLVEAAYLEQDGNNTVLPYVDAKNPSVPFSGPGNSGTQQPTVRQSNVDIQIKAGNSANTGSQVPPNPDAGYTPLYVVNVAYGQTQIQSGDISLAPNAPNILKKLPELPGWIQSGSYWYAHDTGGAANNIIVTLNPVPTAINAGMGIAVKIQNTNTGATNINVNGLGSTPVLRPDGSPLQAGDLHNNCMAFLICDGSVFYCTNPVTALTTVGGGSASYNSGEGVAIDGGNNLNLNFPGLNALSSSPDSTDLFAIYDNSANHHKKITWANLLAGFPGGPSSRGFIGVVHLGIADSSPWNIPNNVTKLLVITVGGGGGGGGAANSTGTVLGGLLAAQAFGYGGAAGGAAFAFMNVVNLGISNVPFTVGTGGSGHIASNGDDGGDTVFGSGGNIYCRARGGPGGPKGGTGNPPPVANGASGDVGDLMIAGEDGSVYGFFQGGDGGASFMGGGGAGGFANRAGMDGGNFGGGGGGAVGSTNTGGSSPSITPSYNPGNGGNGCIFILMFG